MCLKHDQCDSETNQTDRKLSLLSKHSETFAFRVLHKGHCKIFNPTTSKSRAPHQNDRAFQLMGYKVDLSHRFL